MAGLPEADRPDDVEPSPARPFAALDAGADYFATEAHYLSLAGRIVTGLRRGPGLILLIGDPLPSVRVLYPALSKVAAGWCTVVVIACEPELSRDQLLRAVPPSQTPLYVFDDTDRLSDDQIEGVCESLARRDGITAGTLLLARPQFLTRLEGLQPHLFKEGLAIRFQLHELGREEIEPFIRRQLPPGDAAPAFTAQAITAIADFSSGDPATVNRLSRLIASFVQSANSRDSKKPDNGAPSTEEALERSLEAVASERPPVRRRQRGGRLLVGILLCLAIAGFALTPGDRVSFLPAWLRPLNDLISEQLASKELTSEPPNPAPLPAPIAAAPVVVPAEPRPAATAAETIETQPAMPPPAALVTATTEPKPAAPAAETIEAQPFAFPARAPVTAPAEPKPPVATAPSPPVAELPLTPRSSAAETATLVTRGDAFVSMRDIASARLYYERAAELGDGRGALRMGETFDRVFLDRAGIRGTRGDEQEALSWYRRARGLGDAEADRLLKDLEPHQP